MGKGMQKYMKRAFIILAVAAAAIAAALSLFSYLLAGAAFSAERGTVYRIAGAVTDDYPEAVSRIGTALTGGGDAQSGMEALSAYGYDNDRPMWDMPEYRRLALAGIGISAAAGALIFLGGTAVIICHNRKKSSAEAAVMDMLDRCASGDFSFIEDGALNTFENDLVSDQLKKIGRAMKLRSDALDAERDSTKTLVTDISHQLKTPVSALKSCFSVYSVSESESERAEFISRCNAQIDRLESLAGSLISISRLETGMIEPKAERVSMTQLLIDAVNSVYYSALKKNIEIDTEEFQDTAVTADKKWTAEAIANILDNAVKYSPSESTIKIRVMKLYSFVRIEIEDHGIGIPKDERNKVFSRFYRGTAEEVKNNEGSGVGLYLSRRIIESTGGTVSHRPAPHKGTIFTVQLLLA